MSAILTSMRNEHTAGTRVVPLPDIAVEPTPPITDHPYIAKWKLIFADLDRLAPIRLGTLRAAGL